MLIGRLIKTHQDKEYYILDKIIDSDGYHTSITKYVCSEKNTGEIVLIRPMQINKIIENTMDRDIEQIITNIDIGNSSL